MYLLKLRQQSLCGWLCLGGFPHFEAWSSRFSTIFSHATVRIMHCQDHLEPVAYIYIFGSERVYHWPCRWEKDMDDDTVL